MHRHLLAAATLAVGFSALAPDAFAQTRIEPLDLTVSATPALSTDYLFRGISQTRNRPAAQLTLEAVHDSGVYIGAFASNVAFAGTNGRQELDLLAGYRFDAAGISWDIGGIYYTYPGYDHAPGAYEIDYGEVALKATKAFDSVTLLGSAYVSPNYFGRSGTGIYVEGGADLALPWGITASGRVGYQWIEREPRFGTPDYLTYSISASRELAAGVTLAVGYYGTDIDQDRCAGGQKICDGRFMATLSRKF
jgi:uncharacterized protein (TIGR02001 family)